MRNECRRPGVFAFGRRRVARLHNEIVCLMRSLDARPGARGDRGEPSSMSLKPIVSNLYASPIRFPTVHPGGRTTLVTQTHFTKLWAVMVAGLLLSTVSDQAIAQQKFKKENLIGTWIYVTTYTEFPDGKKIPQFTEHPNGIFIIATDARYSHHIMVPGRQKYASGNMWEGTPDEYRATAQGTLSHFGTYTVDEEAGTFTVSIQGSSYPNFEGIKQTRVIVELTPEKLTYVNLVPAVGGGKIYAELRRAN
jgi:hypothetical protein